MGVTDPTRMSPLQRRIAEDRRERLAEAWDKPSTYSVYDKWNDEASSPIGADPTGLVGGGFCHRRNFLEELICTISAWFGR